MSRRGAGMSACSTRSCSVGHIIDIGPCAREAMFSIVLHAPYDNSVIVVSVQTVSRRARLSDRCTACSTPSDWPCACSFVLCYFCPIYIDLSFSTDWHGLVRHQVRRMSPPPPMHGLFDLVLHKCRSAHVRGSGKSLCLVVLPPPF